MAGRIEVSFYEFPPFDIQLKKIDEGARQRRDANAITALEEQGYRELQESARVLLQERGIATTDRFVLSGLTTFIATPYIYKMDQQGKPTEEGLRLRKELTDDGLITTAYVLEITRSKNNPPDILFRIPLGGDVTGGDGKRISLGETTDIPHYFSFIRANTPPSH